MRWHEASDSIPCPWSERPLPPGYTPPAIIPIPAPDQGRTTPQASPRTPEPRGTRGNPTTEPHPMQPTKPKPTAPGQKPTRPEEADAQTLSNDEDGSANPMSALFIGIICIVLSFVMWGFVADAATNPDIPALYLPLYAVFGGVFLIGGLWLMAGHFGMVDLPERLRSR